MADWLLIRLPRTAEQPATWLTVDPRGNPSSPPQSGPLSLAAPRAVGRRVCVLVPGTDVLLTEPEVPMKAGTKLQQVVPFALEEQLADDIDDLHFAMGKRAADSSKIPVAVITRALMDEWLTTLRSQGLEPESLYTESDLLPQNPGQAVALMEEDVIIVRPPVGSPVTLPVEALGEALEIALQGAPEQGSTGGRGLVLYTGAAEWHQQSQKIEALRERFDGIKIQLLSAGPLALFGQQLPTATPINLLQGSYAPAKVNAVGWQAWKVAAILMACLVGLHIAGKSAELSALKRSEKSLDSQIGDTYRTAMQGQQKPSDPRRQMEIRLAAIQNGGGQGGLLPALQALVDSRSAAPGTSIKALSFRQGVVDMKMSAKDASTLDRLGQSLKSRGWKVDFTSGNTTPTGYEGRVQMSGK